MSPILLEKLNNFKEAAKQTTWDTNPEQYDMSEHNSAVLLRQLSFDLLPAEFQLLKNSWSEFRLTQNKKLLDDAVASVVNRATQSPSPPQQSTTRSSYKKRR
jgi:hypothetical protein